jgi:hypothetical protein
MSVKKKSLTVSLFLLSLIYTNSALALNTTFGNETEETVALVSDGIKGFLRGFAGPYIFIIVIAFFALLVIGIFALIKHILSGG